MYFFKLYIIMFRYSYLSIADHKKCWVLSKHICINIVNLRGKPNCKTILKYAQMSRVYRHRSLSRTAINLLSTLLQDQRLHPSNNHKTHMLTS